MSHFKKLIIFSELVFFCLLFSVYPPLLSKKIKASVRIEKISIDASKIIGKYNRLYQGINFMHHYPTYDKPMSKKELSGFKEIGFKYVRMMLPLTKIAPREGEYHWGIDEYRMKQLTENGVEILVAPNYVPSWLSVTGDKNGNGQHSKGINPNKYNKYIKLIKDIIRHYKVEKHYNIKYFEVFNEYNLYHWSPSQLAEIYRMTARAVKSVDSSILVGGPGTTGEPIKTKKFFTEIMNLYKNGEAPLDFISWHNYYSTLKPSLIYDDIATVRKWMKGENINLPIFLTEWAESGGGEKERRLNYAIWSIISIYYQQKAGLDKSFIWELFNPGAFTMFEYDYSGNPAPGFWAYKMLSMLGDNLIDSRPDSLNDKTSAGAGAIATKGDNRISVLVWNYKDTNDIQLKIKLPPGFIGRKIYYKRFTLRPYLVKVETPYQSDSFIAGPEYIKVLTNNLWQGLNLIVLEKEKSNLDINNDNKIDVRDLSIILSNWRKGKRGDLNKDGKIDGNDVAEILNFLGQ